MRRFAIFITVLFLLVVVGSRPRTVSSQRRSFMCLHGVEGSVADEVDHNDVGFDNHANTVAATGCRNGVRRRVNPGEWQAPLLPVAGSSRLWRLAPRRDA